MIASKATGTPAFLRLRMGWHNIDGKRVIHSLKFGIALVLVSLLYMINSLFEQVGENAMWAIMTVVVMFEFYAGCTLAKGINRGIGTIVGGATGCLAAILAHQVGGLAKLITVAFSLFIFGCAITYCRSVPRMKKRYDYGLMISILTFSLVAVSGVHDAGSVVELAVERLATIAMGFVVCISISLLVFPIWAGDELHCSTATKFHKLADSIQGCLDEYIREGHKKEHEGSEGRDYMQDCKAILTSKSNDDSLANFAKWEPWHGKFGLYYPWEKYLEIGENLRELAATVLSLNQCFKSHKQQPLPIQTHTVKELCENFALSIGWILKELGEGIEKMELCQPKSSINPKLQSLKSHCNVQTDENLAIATLNFFLLEIVERVEELVKKVEELGQAAKFRPRKSMDV